MVRAVVEAVDAGAARLEPRGDVPVGLGDERLLDDAARDARLVRDDDDGEAGAVQQPDGVDAVREEDQPLEAIEVSRLLRSGAVAIEKHGRRLMRIAAPPRTVGASTASQHASSTSIPLHAAVIDRTVAQHAGTAEHVMHDHVVIAERRGHPFVGRPEDRRHRHAERRGEVHRARIVGHERRAPREHARRAAAGRSGRSD